MIVKSQLIEQLAKKQPFIEDTEVSSLVNLLLDTMTDALHQGGRIEVRGFGSFSLRIHKARKARNPKTGEKIVTEPHYIVHFKVGSTLRARLNQSRQKVAIQAKSRQEKAVRSIEENT